MSSLRLDWCSAQAARYAVEHWHYSQRMPMPPLLRIGVWEDEQFIGCVLFGRGANYLSGAPFGLTLTECCELVRVALRAHQAPVSRIVSIAMRLLAKTQPGLRLILSYADEAQGHLGGIYQAMNWVYAGRGAESTQYFHKGRWTHSRQTRSGGYGSPRELADYSHLPKRKVLGKHKYLYPLDAEMRTQIAPLARPYPKRAPEALAVDAVGVHPTEGGATPTSALQLAGVD